MSTELDFPMVVGDRLPVLQVTLIGADGVTPLDLSTVDSVTFAMQLTNRSQPALGGTCTPVGDPALGVVQYAWKAGDTDVAGTYDCEWVAAFPIGEMTVPPRAPMKVRIREHV